MISIDGPAASGKTSVSRDLAARLGWSWVSTGAFYRGLAYVAKEQGVDVSNSQKLIDVIKSGDWSVIPKKDKTIVEWNGIDITEKLFNEDVGKYASIVGQIPEVRSELLPLQRKCAEIYPNLVAEGRDCGSVVFPEAILKVYLTASSDSRAKRRAQEQNADINEIKKRQKVRDLKDSTRKSSPLQVAEGARVLDTSELSLDDVVAKIEGWYSELHS